MGLKDFLPQPPWQGLPVPRAWSTTENTIEQVREFVQIVVNPTLPKSQRLRAYGRLGAIKAEIDRLWGIAEGIKLY